MQNVANRTYALPFLALAVGGQSLGLKLGIGTRD
jgi:hypothetical protein